MFARVGLGVFNIYNKPVLVIRPALLLFAQHERILTGASPQRALTAGSVQPTTRVFIARCNLKEVFGKDLT